MNTPSPTPDLHRNHLPNLGEVLNRRTLAPVDLFSFYIYMRDQQRSVDYLDFWCVPSTIVYIISWLILLCRLDVHQHMSLCRHYVRELRRSVLVDTPDLDKTSKRSSAVLDRAEFNMNNQYSDSDHETGRPGPSNYYNEKQRGYEEEGGVRDTHGVSAFLRQDSGSKHSASNSNGSNISSSPRRPPKPGYATGSSQHPSPGTGDSTSPGQASHESPNTTVTRHDIRRSAEKILYTYLLPGSEREVILPTGIINAVVHAIEDEGRDDPEVFDAAQDYVFQAMERDAFPGFLKSKALGNLVPPSMMIRLIVGLLSLFGALWTAFILIFLDYSRQTRCWVSLLDH